MPRGPRRFWVWRDRFREPALTTMLVVQVLIILVGAPYSALGYPGARATMGSLVMIYALLAILIARGRVATVVAVIATTSTMVGTVYSVIAPTTTIFLLSHIGGITGATVVAIVIGRAVFAPGPISTHRVVGAIVLYLNFGLIAGSCYRVIWDLIPNAISGVPSSTDVWEASGSLLYFSFVTLTTIGYGDIVPVHPIARAIANLEGIIGQLYPATLLARLVTMELEAHRRD